MERIIVGIVSKLRFAANALIPINRLPPEILCEVFFHFRPVIKRGSEQPQSGSRPFEDLLAITHTCHLWRITAIGAADLWSQLIARDPRKNMDDMIRLFINRSGDLPLDADLGYGSEVVTPYTDRLRTLTCRGDAICHLGSRAAPSLETLYIHSRDYFYFESPPLPTLFNRDSPSLRELVVSGRNPLTNNRFRNLSCFRLQLTPGNAGPTFWTPLLATLRDCPQLEELFLRFSAIHDYPLLAQDTPTPATLHTLRKLHLHGIPSSLTRWFMNSVNFAPNGIAMQFTNIVPEFDWLFPPALPLELSPHAVTSLEIVYGSSREFIMQGTNPGMQIRVAVASGLDAIHGEIFSHLARQTNPQSPLRELWIHIEREEEYRFTSLSQFQQLKKLVVRVTTNRNHICRLLRMLDIKGCPPCPLLSTLDLSGILGVDLLLKVLKARSKVGCRLERLRLGKAHILVEDIVRSRVQDYVDELEIFDVDAEPCGMELPAVCATELGEWWKPWTKRHRFEWPTDSQYPQ